MEFNNKETQFDFYWKRIFDGLAYNPIEFNVYRFDQSMSLPSKFNKLYTMFKELALNNQEVMDYLKEFVETFDFKLDTTVKDIFLAWIEDGFLTETIRELINEEVIIARGSHPNLRSRLDEVDNKQQQTTTQLTQKANANSYYYPTVNITATNGTGEINADTISYSEMISLWDELANKYPKYVHKNVLGKDSSGQYIVYRYDFISSEPNDYIVMDANIHGNGPNGDPKDATIALYYFFKDLCENTKINDKLADAKKLANYSVIPIANPWGFDNDSRENFNGIDLNRNFEWNFKKAGSGDHPFSEVETRYIRYNLLRVQEKCNLTHHKVISYIPFHSYGGSARKLSPHFPFSASNTSPIAVVFRSCGNYLSEKYGYSASGGIGTPSAASADNYAERILGIPSATPEFPVYRNDRHERDKFAVTQHVEFFGNLIYQCISMNLDSKLKLSLLSSKNQMTIPFNENTVLKDFENKYSENNFPFDEATGEVTIPVGVEYVRIKAQISFYLDSEEVEEFPLGVYLYKNDGSFQYSGYTIIEKLVRMGGSITRGRYATMYMETPVLHCAANDKFRLIVFKNATKGVLKTSPNLSTTWISVEEVPRYK